MDEERYPRCRRQSRGREVMAKITVNEVEYDTENFSKTQIAIVNEMLIIKRKLEDLDYERALYVSRNELLLKALEKSLEENKEEPND